MLVVKVVGVGNRMYGDDGLGPCLVFALRNCVRSVAGSNDGSVRVDYVVLDRPSHGDIGLLEDGDVILFVDSSPQEGIVLNRVELSRASSDDLVEAVGSSAGHNLSPLLLLALAFAAGLLRGKKAYLLTVGPLAPEFGRGLSSVAVKLALKAAATLEHFFKRELGYQASFDFSCVESILAGLCSDPLSELSESSSMNLL